MITQAPKEKENVNSKNPVCKNVKFYCFVIKDKILQHIALKQHNVTNLFMLKLSELNLGSTIVTVFRNAKLTEQGQLHPNTRFNNLFTTIQCAE